MTVLTAFSTLLLFISIAGCSADKENLPPPGGNECSTVNAKFSATVAPLIQSKCAIASCHSSAGQAGGFALTDYSQISARAGAINTAVQGGIMPKVGSLTAAEKLIIKCWVTSGAQNN